MAIFLIAGYTSAQIKLTGVVKDSLNSGLEMANIIAVNTTTKAIDSYGFTDAFGNYKLNLNTNSRYKIRASYIGMKTGEIIIETKKSDLKKDIVLIFDNTLDEVEIISKMPVTIKGDTIVYNADSFKSGTEKKLGDVLKKLPGVEVNDDGEIQVEGKTVKKVMIEGKDFFDGDSKLATKNIPANAIDKVQVLKNHSEVNQMSSVTDNEDNIVINLKLKEGKKNFWFGNIALGAGVLREDERYSIRPKLFYYSPKYSLNILTDFNNIGDVPFTMRDYFKFTGGFRDSGSDGTSFNVNSSDLGFLTLRNNRAKEITSRFGAFNFSYAPSKTWDLSGFLIYSGSDIDMEVNTVRNYINPNVNDVTSIENEEAESLTEQRLDLGIMKLSSSYKPNSTNQFDYDVLAKLSSQSELQSLNSKRITINNAITNVPINQIRRQNPYTVKQNMNYYYTLNEQNIFAFEGQYLIQDEDPFYNAQLKQLSFSNLLGLANDQTVFNVSQNKRIKTSKVDAKLDYFYVINSKSNLNLTLGNTIANQQFNSSIFQTLSNENQLQINNTNVLNDVDYFFDDYYLGIHYKFISGAFTFNQGATAHKYTAKNTQLNNVFINSFTRLLPDASIKMALKKSENIRLNYSQKVRFTDINNVAEGFVLNNYNGLYSGNQDLESALSHNLSLSYFNFNMFDYSNMFASINYVKSIDPVKGVTRFEGIDQIASSANSIFPDESISGVVNYQKSYRKFKVTFESTISYITSNNLFFSQQTNENENLTSNSFTQAYKAKFSSNFKNTPNFDIGYNLSVNQYNQGGIVNTFTTHSPYVNFDTFIGENLIFNTRYTYNNFRNQSQVLNDYSFWSADLTYQQKKSRWEYKLRSTNLLNTRSLNQDNSNTIFNGSSNYLVQPRFVTLSVKFNLN